MGWVKMNSFYSKEELIELGLAHVGEEVLISRKCSIYSAENISIGNHVRIDDFCILSGKIVLDNYIHIAAYCGLFGGTAGITIEDYSTLSSKGTIYAISDDYSGETMTNPMIDDRYKNIMHKRVTIGRHVIIGTHSIILPGVIIEEGCAIGASSMITKDCKSWGIYIGTPAKRVKERSKRLLMLEQTMKTDIKEDTASIQLIKSFQKPIYVTQSFLPPIEAFEKKIQTIWEKHWLTNNGPLHDELEEKIKRYLKVKHAVLFANGHLALDIAIKVLKLTGEVITTPFTFASTPHAITMNNLTPVFADINPVNFTLDADQIEALITEKTSAIIPVHVFGYPCDVKVVEKLAVKYNLKVIYDAAHVFGVELDEKGIGSFGDIAMFSLHATKVYHAIEGGVLTFGDKSLETQLKLYKNFGIAGPEQVETIGINAKMNEFQAAMGLINLDFLDDQIAHRKKISDVYQTKLGKVEGVSFAKVGKNVKSNYAYFPIVIDEDKTHISRDELQEKLQKYNVFTRKYFYPLVTDFTCYKEQYLGVHLSTSKYISNSILTLPIYGDLTLEEASQIADIISFIIKEKGLQVQ